MLVAVVLVAYSLELLQVFIPNRDGRLPDAIEKCLGGRAGIAVGWAINKLISRTSAS